MDRIGEIKERCEKATKGPWSLWTSCSWRRIGSEDPESYGTVIEPTIQHSDNHPDLYFRNKVDADFVIHSRSDIPYLLAKLSQAEKEFSEARAETERWKEGVAWLAECVIRDRNGTPDQQGWIKRAFEVAEERVKDFSELEASLSHEKAKSAEIERERDDLAVRLNNRQIDAGNYKDKILDLMERLEAAEACLRHIQNVYGVPKEQNLFSWRERDRIIQQLAEDYFKGGGV